MVGNKSCGKKTNSMEGCCGRGCSGANVGDFCFDDKNRLSQHYSV